MKVQSKLKTYEKYCEVLNFFLIAIICTAIIVVSRVLIIPLVIILVANRFKPRTKNKIIIYSLAALILTSGINKWFDLIHFSRSVVGVFDGVDIFLICATVLLIFFIGQIFLTKIKYGWIKTIILSVLSYNIIKATLLMIVFFELFPQKENLKRNYELHQNEISDLKQYFELITNHNKIKVRIEFDKDGISSIATKNSNEYKSASNFTEDGKEKIRAIIKYIGLKDDSINLLKKKLDEINCRSIDNMSEPLQIGFKSIRKTYNYRVFDKDLTEKEIEKFNDGCHYSYYKRNIILEYRGSEFVGEQCFEDFKR